MSVDFSFDKNLGSILQKNGFCYEVTGDRLLDCVRSSHPIDLKDCKIASRLAVNFNFDYNVRQFINPGDLFLFLAHGDFNDDDEPTTRGFVFLGNGGK